MDPTKYRKNKETSRKPYRSDAAFYTDYKDEIPDGDYYGLKHSEFKKPWLPASGYDEMEYKWDFPLEYLNPISADFEVPDMGKYKFPDAPTVNPNWTPPRWNPQYPTPEFPEPKPYAKKKPGTNGGTQIIWTYCEGHGFEFCPGETVSVKFTEYTTDPIVAVDAGGAPIIRTPFGMLGESRHRPGYPEGTFTVTIKIPETTGRDIDVTATTKSGETCVSRGTQRATCLGCEGVSILYTSTQMQVGESQLLSVNNPMMGTKYEWELIGPGTLTEQRGLNTAYIAPSSNPNCRSASIRLFDYNTRQICALLSIAINAYTDPGKVAFREANNDYHADYVCAKLAPDPCDIVMDCLSENPDNPGFAIGYRCTYTEYACDGSPIMALQYVKTGCPPQMNAILTEKQHCASYGTSCCGGGCNKCSDANAIALAQQVLIEANCINIRGPWGDVRTQDMKDAGCCPSQLL